MQAASKEEVLRNVAEMAEQLATMCQEHDRFLSAALRGAAQMARQPDQQKHAP